MAYEEKAGDGIISPSKFYEEGTKQPTHFGKMLLDQNLIDKIIANGFVLPISGWYKSGGWGELISLSADVFTLDKQEGNKKKDGFDQAKKIVDDNKPDEDVPF